MSTNTHPWHSIANLILANAKVWSILSDPTDGMNWVYLICYLLLVTQNQRLWQKRSFLPVTETYGFWLKSK